MEFSVYILFSNKLNKFYVGTSNDVNNRILEHNNIKYPNAFTEKGIPWELFLAIDNLSSEQAFALEKHIKKMKSKNYIINLKKFPELVEKLRYKFEVAGSSR